jgi:GMP synthase (glutamine-hydrolysing)
MSAVVSLGGQMSVTNLSEFPFLVDELNLMKSALKTELPTFGLCLGAQLLALAAGGRVSTMARRYIGWPNLALTPAGRHDPLFGECPSDIPVIKWHADAIDVPPAVSVIATTASPGCAIFRVGPCAWGSQTHLEADPDMLFSRWLPDQVEQRAMIDAGLDPEAFALQCKDKLPDQMDAMRPVFLRFADYVVAGRPKAGHASSQSLST